MFVLMVVGISLKMDIQCSEFSFQILSHDNFDGRPCKNYD